MRIECLLCRCPRWYSFCVAVCFADPLYPLDADIADFQRHARGASWHVHDCLQAHKIELDNATGKAVIRTIKDLPPLKPRRICDAAAPADAPGFFHPKPITRLAEGTFQASELRAIELAVHFFVVPHAP